MRAWCVGLAIAAGCTGGGADRRLDWGPPGPPGDVTVIVDLNGNETYTTIAVDDADGVRTITDDAIGTFTVSVHPPAAVSQIVPGASYAMSFVGVEPGDTLCFACPALPTDVEHTVSV